MAKPSDVKTATLTRQDWSKLTGSLDYNKRLLYKDVLTKLMLQIDD